MFAQKEKRDPELSTSFSKKGIENVLNYTTGEQVRGAVLVTTAERAGCTVACSMSGGPSVIPEENVAEMNPGGNILAEELNVGQPTGYPAAGEFG